MRDIIAWAATSDAAGTAPLIIGASRATGYTSVYVFEILLLIAGLAAIGPLVGRDRTSSTQSRDSADQPFGLREFPT
jgi:BCD family chlorophyll transporter-like MFS transporter